MELPDIRQSHEKLETINEFKKKHRNSQQVQRSEHDKSNGGSVVTTALSLSRKATEKIPANNYQASSLDVKKPKSRNNVRVNLGTPTHIVEK